MEWEKWELKWLLGGETKWKEHGKGFYQEISFRGAKLKCTALLW